MKPATGIVIGTGITPWQRVGPWLGLALAVIGPTALAQPYSIDWYTLDGGGGMSTGGSYTLSGTIGQPDAGVLSGGTYTLQGGFWPGLIVPGTGERPTLLIQPAGVDLSISWNPTTTGFALEAADDPASPTWTPVAHGDTSPVVISPTSGAKFYRLRHP